MLDNTVKDGKIMMKINEIVLVNGSMKLNVIATVGNIAFLKRLGDSSFVVVDGLDIELNGNKCEWSFAYGYFSKFDDAIACFKEKTKGFIEY